MKFNEAQLKEMTTDQLVDIVDSHDDEHGTIYVDDAIIVEYDIEWNDDYTKLVYKNEEYDSFVDIVIDNEEIENAYKEELVDLIINCNWNYN